ncbi:hypothetical protein, partial [Gordoniibacillus kamchatkensis]|uniref:hypothetical protein n=1 Tax=Gordoniibacillus kamchatkensis TaxID=1590651 RepID=UPI001E448986
FPLIRNVQKLTVMVVRILTDIMTRTSIQGKEKTPPFRCGAVRAAPLETSSHHNMVIVSDFSLVEKEPDTGVFC